MQGTTIQNFDCRIRRKETAWVTLGIVGRIILKWVPNKLYLKLTDWVYFAYDVNQWLCFQNTVINMHVQEKARNILRSRRELSLSTKTLFQRDVTCGRAWHIVACQRRVCQLRNVMKSFSSHTACSFLCPITECDMCGYIHRPAR